MHPPLQSTAISGILQIAKIIADNIDLNTYDNGHYKHKLSHKEVITLGIIASTFGPVDCFGSEVKDYIECLLWAIVKSGSTHFVRSFAAKQIIVTIKTAIDKHKQEFGQPFPNEF
jgi:hypothetical protein